MNSNSNSFSADELRSALKRHFGFEDFLDYQSDVVQAVASGADYCVIMPTGAGKSLCYQLPIMLKKGYGIVVSPFFRSVFYRLILLKIALRSRTFGIAILPRGGV